MMSVAGAALVSEPGPVLRLRPSVHASPTAGGIVVRGWRTAFRAAGGDLWPLWQRLEPALRLGVAIERLDPVDAPERARRAVRDLLAALREHDMTVATPPAWWGAGRSPSAEVAGWLEEISPDPAATWHRITAGPVRVAGAGALGEACLRALDAVGMRAVRSETLFTEARLVILTTPRHGVVVGAGDDRGFVTVAGPDRERSAVRIADRLGLEPGAVPGLLAAVLGSAAADRLVHLVGGLAGSEPPLDPRPGREVLVVGPEPLSATDHSWLGDAPGPAPIRFRGAVGRRVEALVDPELGLLAAPRSDDLPQVPVALATCAGTAARADERPCRGIGPTTSAARLDAVLRAAERSLEPSGTGRLSVGLDVRHADGVLLRRAVFELAGRAATVRAAETEQPAVDPDDPDDPVVRRWWRALTVRFALPATAAVVRLGEGVFVARVHTRARELGWAIEATADDALAFAAMHAVAAEQAAGAGIESEAGPMTMCGAAFGSSSVAADSTPGPTRAWSWPQPARHEAALQRALRRLLPGDRKPFTHAGSADDETLSLTQGLSAAGFAVRALPGAEVGLR